MVHKPLTPASHEVSIAEVLSRAKWQQRHATRDLCQPFTHCEVSICSGHSRRLLSRLCPVEDTKLNIFPLTCIWEAGPAVSWLAQVLGTQIALLGCQEVILQRLHQSGLLLQLLAQARLPALCCLGSACAQPASSFVHVDISGNE